MQSKKLQRKVAAGILAMTIASTTLLLTADNVYAATAEEDQDQLIKSVEQRIEELKKKKSKEATKQKAQDATSFSERIKAILDEYNSDSRSGRDSTKYRINHEGDLRNNSPIDDYSYDGGMPVADYPVPAKTEVENTTTTKPPTPATNQTPPPVIPTPNLTGGRYNFDWQGTPIAQSLYAVAKIAHRDVVVNGELSGKVYISLNQVTCDEAMDYLSRAFNFNWMVDGNAIIVSTDKLMKQSETFKIRHAFDLEKVTGEMTALGIDAANIYANTEARTVSVTGTPYQLKQAASRLQVIDKPVSQCLILAQLIEINHGKDLKLGMQYSLPTYSHTGTTSGITTDESFRGNWLEKLTFSASAQASKELSKGHVISRPMVMMMNGQEGEVYFGENVPVLSATSTTAATNITVEYHQVGTKLTITPSINENEGEIALKIKTEVSNISQWLTSGYTQAPQISSRQATTSAHLRSGQSFVIGGLMSVTELDNLSGIPGLMDLPILGKLFSYHSKSKDYAEVYIMITPYIVSDDIDPQRLLNDVQKLEGVEVNGGHS